MAELQRKTQDGNDQLTTADLAERTAPKPPDRTPTREKQESTGGPTLVTKENERADAGKAGLGEIASTPLFSHTQVTELRERWSDVQSAFVDAPRKAVEGADKLVAAVMQELAEGFAKERSNLETQWAQGADVSTEDLRLVLQRYRSFFDRLLSA